MSIYDGWQNVDTRHSDYEHEEWTRSRKDKRIKELERQVEMLSGEVNSLRHELAQMREAVRG